MISRIALFAQDDPLGESDAVQLCAAIGAITNSNAVWDRFTRRDGSETQGGVITLPGLVIEVHGGEPRLPGTLEFTVPDLEAAKERLVSAGFTPKESGMLRGAHIRVGGPAERGITVVAVQEQVEQLDLSEFESGVTGDAVWLRWPAEQSGVPIKRKVIITRDTNLDELLHEESPELREWAAAEVEKLQAEVKA